MGCLLRGITESYQAKRRLVLETMTFVSAPRTYSSIHVEPVSRLSSTCNTINASTPSDCLGGLRLNNFLRTWPEGVRARKFTILRRAHRLREVVVTNPKTGKKESYCNRLSGQDTLISSTRLISLFRGRDDESGIRRYAGGESERFGVQRLRQ